MPTTIPDLTAVTVYGSAPTAADLGIQLRVSGLILTSVSSTPSYTLAQVLDENNRIIGDIGSQHALTFMFEGEVLTRSASINTDPLGKGVGLASATGLLTLDAALSHGHTIDSSTVFILNKHDPKRGRAVADTISCEFLVRNYATRA